MMTFLMFFDAQSGIGNAAASPVLSQVAVSTVIVVVMQWLKKASWFPLLTAQSKNVSRAVAALLSLLAGVGIHMTWNHDAGTLVISGLTLASIIGLLGAWLKSHCVQEGLYRLYEATGNNIDIKALAQAVAACLKTTVDELPPTPVVTPIKPGI